jgi:putative ABC transport system permease protein
MASFSRRTRVQPEECSDDAFHDPLLQIQTRQDTGQSGRVAVVTEEFARKYLPNEEPLGHRLDPSDWNAEIIGVVADVRHKSPNRPLEPAIYIPLSQQSRFMVCLVVRTEGDPCC